MTTEEYSYFNKEKSVDIQYKLRYLNPKYKKFHQKKIRNIDKLNNGNDSILNFDPYRFVSEWSPSFADCLIAQTAWETSDIEREHTIQEFIIILMENL